MVSNGKLMAFINALVGGTAPAPSEVVILPETEYAVDGSEVPITTPLSAIPEAGAMVKINYNGAEYKSPVIFIPGDEEMPYAIGMGNTDKLGLPGGNTDAPFAVVIYSESFDGMYGLIVPMEEVTSITISIVQESGASAGGGASGEYIIVADATTLETTQRWSELAAAASAGRCVQMALRMVTESGVVDVIYWPMARMTANGAISALQFYNPGLILNKAGRYNVAAGDDDSIVITTISGD